jgi:hypothetical protein
MSQIEHYFVNLLTALLFYPAQLPSLITFLDRVIKG